MSPSTLRDGQTVRNSRIIESRYKRAPSWPFNGQPLWKCRRYISFHQPALATQKKNLVTWLVSATVTTPLEFSRGGPLIMNPLPFGGAVGGAKPRLSSDFTPRARALAKYWRFCVNLFTRSSLHQSRPKSPQTLTYPPMISP
jgi:hypothetical protein